jgi:hypothetical protein
VGCRGLLVFLLGWSIPCSGCLEDVGLDFSALISAPHLHVEFFRLFSALFVKFGLLVHHELLVFSACLVHVVVNSACFVLRVTPPVAIAAFERGKICIYIYTSIYI